MVFRTSPELPKGTLGEEGDLQVKRSGGVPFDNRFTGLIFPVADVRYFFLHARGLVGSLPHIGPIDAVLRVFHPADDDFDQEVCCVGDISRVLPVFSEVFENGTARFSNRPEIICASTRAKRQYPIELLLSANTKVPARKTHMFKLLLICLVDGAEDTQSLVSQAPEQCHNIRCALAIQSAGRLIEE